MCVAKSTWEDLFVLQFVNVTGFEKEHPWHGALLAMNI